MSGPISVWRQARASGAGPVLVPLARGAGAFVAPSRLVSLLEPPGPRSSWPQRLLERLQAKRSRLLVATDRAVAVACVRRWNLDLSRIRLVPDLEGGLENKLGTELKGGETGRAAWHSVR